MNPPKQEPTQSDIFQDWQDHKLEEKSSEFHYSDNTQDHTMDGESQKFHYEGNDLPEKE